MGLHGNEETEDKRLGLHDRAPFLLGGFAVGILHRQCQRALLFHGEQLLKELGDVVVVLGARLYETRAPFGGQLRARLLGHFSTLKRQERLGLK